MCELLRLAKCASALSMPRARPARRLIAASLFVTACHGGSDARPTTTGPTTTVPSPELTTVSVSLSAATISVGQTATASAAGLDQKGAPIGLGSVTWTLSTPAVATVNASGTVTGVAVGQTQIIATAGGKQGSALLTVTEIPVATVTLSLGYTSLMPGQTTEGRVVVRDAGGNALSGRTVVWTSSDTTLATVTRSGFVLGLGPGTVTISATSSAVSGSATLSIQPLPPPVVTPVIEYSPPVYPASGGMGMSVILDAPATTTSATYALTGTAPVAFRRLGNSSRFIVVLPDTQTARTCNAACGFGTASIVGASGTLTVANTSAPQLATGTPAVTVTPLAPDVQRSQYIVNIRDDDVRQNNNTPHIAQRFYQYFGDTFEYLGLSEMATTGSNPNFFGVRNRVAGTGQLVYDRSALFGTSPSGKLRGFMNYRNYFDLAHQVATHEMGHAFCCFLQNVALSSGSPHWPLSTTAFAIMGSNGPPGANAGWMKLTPVGGGAFRVDLQSPAGGLNNLELYLMGLADSSEVENQLVFQNQTQTVQVGAVLQGPTTVVTIRDIVSANGKRPTDYAGTPVTFHLAMIVVSRGRLLTAAEMSYFDDAARRGEATTSFDNQFVTPFFVNTRGRGVLVTRIP